MGVAKSQTLALGDATLRRKKGVGVGESFFLFFGNNITVGFLIMYV